MFDLIGDVHMENPGTKGLLLDLTKIAPIRINKLRLAQNGQYEVAEEGLALPFLASEPILDVVVEGKGSASLKFVARLQGPELYSVEFWSTSPSTAGFWMSYVIIEVGAHATRPLVAAAREDSGAKNFD